MGCVRGDIRRLDAVTGGISRLDRVTVGIRRLDAVTGRISLVCDVDTTHYLEVSPSAPMWITTGTPVVYRVTSDTSWTVEY